MYNAAGKCDHEWGNTFCFWGDYGVLRKRRPIRCVEIAMYTVTIATYRIIGVKFLLRANFVGWEFAINIGKPVSYS